jgi:hypothetical protein
LLAVKVCSIFYEANERPRHATATVAIRSKPVAPGGVEQQQLYDAYNTPVPSAGQLAMFGMLAENQI